MPEGAQLTKHHMCQNQESVCDEAAALSCFGVGSGVGRGMHQISVISVECLLGHPAFAEKGERQKFTFDCGLNFPAGISAHWTGHSLRLCADRSHRSGR